MKKIKSLSLILILLLSLIFTFPVNTKALTSQTDLVSIENSENLTVGDLSFSNISFQDNSLSSSLAFGLTAGLFLFMGLFGLIFKNAARKLQTFAYVGLVFLLIASLISFFVTQDWLITAISALGIIVFSIITMVDMRFIVDMMNNSSNPDSVSIYGAFVLYLDFINIFLYIVRIILSSRKN